MKSYFLCLSMAFHVCCEKLATLQLCHHALNCLSPRLRRLQVALSVSLLIQVLLNAAIVELHFYKYSFFILSFLRHGLGGSDATFNGMYQPLSVKADEKNHKTEITRREK